MLNVRDPFLFPPPQTHTYPLDSPELLQVQEEVPTLAEASECASDVGLLELEVQHLADGLGQLRALRQTVARQTAAESADLAALGDKLAAFAGRADGELARVQGQLAQARTEMLATLEYFGESADLANTGSVLRRLHNFVRSCSDMGRQK